MDSSPLTHGHLGVTQRPRWGQHGLGLGTGGLPSCAVGVTGVQLVEVASGSHCRAASGGEGKQALTGAPGTLSLSCHPRLEEVGPQHLSWGQPPAPASQVLGPWGTGGWCLLGVFPGPPRSLQIAPGVGPPGRVGRGVLGNLMFSTLTPSLSLKWVWGLLPKAAIGLDPSSLSSLPASRALAGEGQWPAVLQSPPLRGPSRWLSRVCSPPTLAGIQPGNHLALIDTFSERGRSGRLRAVVGVASA